MANIVQCPPILFPLTNNCSDRGVCEEGRCVCEGGWDGKGDLLFQKDCGINEQATQALWGICSVIYFTVLVYSLYFLIKILKREERFSARNQRLSFGFTALLASIFLFVFSIIRTAYVRDRALGGDVSLTIIFGIGSSFFYIALNFFHYGFLSIAYLQIKYHQLEDSKRLFLRIFLFISPISVIIAIVGSFLLIGCLSAKNANEMYLYGSLHYILAAVNLFFMGVIAIPYIIQLLAKDIKAALGTSSNSKQERETLIKILKKLQEAGRSIRTMSILNIILILLFGIWPYLQGLSSYFLPINWSLGGISAIQGIYTISPVEMSYKRENVSLHSKVATSAI